MNIAIDVSPLHSGHKIRGTGFYLTHLKDALLEYFPKNIYHFFTTLAEIPKAAEIVHFPYFEPFFLTLPLWKRKKTIVTIHDLTPLVFPKDFPPGKKGIIKWQIQKRIIASVDAIITDSVSSKKDIEKFCTIPSEKISVVYLAAGQQYQVVSQKMMDDVRKKYNLPQKFVLYVGDATANKNLPRLITAVTQSGLPMIMIGKTLSEDHIDHTNAWNSSLIEAKKLIEKNSAITTLGFVSNDDLVALYNCATVFVMPSLYEGFGLPILEAMACGCPVITSKEGSLPEIAGDAAYYVDAYSIESIAKGIVAVFHDEKMQKELTEKGLAQAKKFTWKNTAEKTMQVYEKVSTS